MTALEDKEIAMTDYSLLQDFIVETVEHLEEMESNLLRLEANSDNRETLDNIFRSVHTIKGASEYLGLEGLAELSHKLENLLDRLRREEHIVDRNVIDLLMAVRDRMGLLIEDLESTQTEQTVFTDLIERLRTIESDLPVEETAPAAPAESAATASPDADHEEEFDEELFAIFLEQLEEGLNNLKVHTQALYTADRDDQIGILTSCLTRIDPLRSSANYMGYDHLTELYDGWSASIRHALERLEAGDDSFLPDFVRDYMEAHLATVAGRFPRLQIAIDTVSQPAIVTAAPADDDEPVPPTDTDTAPSSPDLLEVYVDETPQDPGSTVDQPAADPGVTADLFERLSQSFDDCRQQGVAPQRAVGTAEIAAELFSTPDVSEATDDGDHPPATPVTAGDTPAAAANARDYLAGTSEQAGAATVATPSENAAPGTDMTPEGTSAPDLADDPVENDRDRYEEEYDEELFGIFLEQLGESLGALKAHAGVLAEANGGDPGALLEDCLAHIDPLRSSANYMGYARLTALYDEWIGAIQEAQICLANGEDGFLKEFVDTQMVERIAAVVECFPQIRIPDPVVGDGDAKPGAEVPAPVEDTAAPSDDLVAAGLAVEAGEGDWPAVEDRPHQPDDDAPAPPDAAINPDDSLESSLLNDFLVETVEHLEEMEGSLLNLERAPGNQRTLDDIFRSAHTIKGAAEYLGMVRIADLSHQLENLLDQMRRNAKSADRDTIDLLIAARDRIGLLTEDLAQSGQEQTAIDDLLERIRNLQEETTVPAPDNAVAEEVPVPAAERQDPDGADLEIPLFEGTPDEDGDSPAHEFPTSIAADDSDDVIAIASAIEAVAADDVGTAIAEHPESVDRRDPERQGRRQSDRIGGKILKQSIRVDATKIDDLMNQVGELVVSRAWFAQLFSEMRELQQSLKQRFKLDTREMKKVKGLTFRLSEATVALGRVANELQEGVMKVRMLPIAQLFNRYPRLVFDLVRDTDKQVELDIRGEETELDKMVIEEISDPLIHIIRNAVDHGVETVVERRRQGKPESATIRLEAYHEGNHVVIEIADDGRGLDLERIRTKALAGNFASREELERMGPKELTGLIMQPGFSTAEQVTHTSGRGVGMDVVKKNIEKLNGTIEIDTTPGVETRFRIKIPLTLAIIPALLIKVREELFTIPLATVEETLRIEDEHISTIEGVEVMQLRESTLPLVRLDGLFKMAAGGSIDRAFVVVVSTGMKRVGLLVDELLGQEEVVIKPLEDYLQERSGFSGATILGDGRISLILDVYELVNLSIDREAQKKAKAAAL